LSTNDSHLSPRLHNEYGKSILPIVLEPV
jgi:hypothetical protein